MPIYEFTCRQCGHEFEALLRQAAAPVTCPSCGNSDTERHLSTFAVSSDGTRDKNLQQVRKDGRKASYDKVRSEEEAILRHHEDHSH